MERARTVFLLTLGVVLLQLAMYYPQMPPVMASHFSGAGQPNGWMTRNIFFAFWVGMMAILTVSFLWIPALTMTYRAKKWNLPNLEYWLAPERKDTTVRFIHGQVLWFGVMNNMMMLAVGQLVFQANLGQAPALDSTIGWILAGYFLYTGFWLIHLFHHFAKLPRSGVSTPV